MLDIEGVRKVFRRDDREIVALDGISVTAKEGEFVTVVGPSGCGKSTLLHILGGFEQPSEGCILLDGQPLGGPSRERGMVFQQATLFPWWTIEANVAWALRTGGTAKKAALVRARELLELVGLGGFGDAFPSELSGGMQQRAALARTLSLEPKLLLMDEPFGALDAQTRELMQEELNRIWHTAGITVVFITHDIYEAVFLGDRVLVMSGRPGRIIEDLAIDLPRPRDADIKNHPRYAEYHTHLWEQLRDDAASAEARRR